MLGRCFEPIIESATTAESNDSIPASNAIVTALESCALIFSKENIERLMVTGGRPAGISANCFPIVLTSRWKNSTRAAVTTTAIKDPGIFLKNKGHTMRMISAMAPIMTACQLSVVMFFASAMIFSPVSMGFSPCSNEMPVKSFT